LWNHQDFGHCGCETGGAAVRVALSREGVFRIAGGRTVTRQRVALGPRRTARWRR